MCFAESSSEKIQRPEFRSPSSPFPSPVAPAVVSTSPTGHLSNCDGTVKQDLGDVRDKAQPSLTANVTVLTKANFALT